MCGSFISPATGFEHTEDSTSTAGDSTTSQAVQDASSAQARHHRALRLNPKIDQGRSSSSSRVCGSSSTPSVALLMFAMGSSRLPAEAISSVCDKWRYATLHGYELHLLTFPHSCEATRAECFQLKSAATPMYVGASTADWVWYMDMVSRGKGKGQHMNSPDC